MFRERECKDLLKLVMKEMAWRFLIFRASDWHGGVYYESAT